jgi:hypothetical protein
MAPLVFTHGIKVGVQSCYYRFHAGLAAGRQSELATRLLCGFTSKHSTNFISIVARLDSFVT